MISSLNDQLQTPVEISETINDETICDYYALVDFKKN